MEDAATTELLAGADVLLVIGSSLGEVTSNYFTLRPRGQVIQIDAEPRVLESNVTALGIQADAKLALAGLRARLTPGRPTGGLSRPSPHCSPRCATGSPVRSSLTRGVLAAIREAVPDDTVTFWDMTIAAYWAWSCWDARTGRFHSAQGPVGSVGRTAPGWVARSGSAGGYWS